MKRILEFLCGSFQLQGKHIETIGMPFQGEILSAIIGGDASVYDGDRRSDGQKTMALPIDPLFGLRWEHLSGDVEGIGRFRSSSHSDLRIKIVFQAGLKAWAIVAGGNAPGLSR